MAEGFRWTGAAMEPRAFEYIGQIAPAGSGSSSAADMGRYMMMMLNGGTLDGVSIYGPVVAQALRTAPLRTAPDIDVRSQGLKLERLPGGFDGLGLPGETLSFKANMVMAPALGLGVFVAGNSDSAGSLAERLPSLIVEHFYAVRPPPRRPAAIRTPCARSMPVITSASSGDTAGLRNSSTFCGAPRRWT